MADSSMSQITPLLYVKTGCPWCEEVLEYFNSHQLPYEKIVVSGNPQAMAEMVALSGQSKAPTMDWDGEILADFGVDELIPFLKEHA
jgi:glutaredoxin